eukprot:SAG11_NODE_3798_length_2218_cov_1.281265_2_plen_92_part_00
MLASAPAQFAAPTCTNSSATRVPCAPRRDDVVSDGGKSGGGFDAAAAAGDGGESLRAQLERQSALVTEQAEQVCHFFLFIYLVPFFPWGPL